jgi:ATP-dependent helicase/nuclease subunit B
LYRLPSELSTHLKRGRTLIVPTRQRARAVQLAQAAAEIASGRQVWASADVLTVRAWRRREIQRAAGERPSEWPRLLSGAEEWFLWRLCALEATAGLTLLDGSAFADALMQASELAADYGIALSAAAPGSEAALLYETQRAFTARCQGLGAAPASALCERLPIATDPPRLAWLCGFDALAPRLRRHARLSPAAAAPALSEPAVVLAADARQESEHIAAWCQARIARDPGARLLVMMPGAHGPRERLASLIRQTLDPASLLEAGPPCGGWVAIEGGEPLLQQPMIAQALTTLGFLSGREFDPDQLGAWLRAPHGLHREAPLRARLARLLSERALPRGGLRDLLGALQLVTPPLQGPARELWVHLTRAQAALGEAQASARSWSERFRAALAAAGWASQSASGTAQQALLRWHELLEEFGELNRSAGSMSRAQALQLLRELAARSAWRPADEDVSVTISAVLADPIVHYDGIWVAGLDAQSFPQPLSPNPFLPLHAQRSAQVPAASSAQRLAQARTLLGAWRASSPALCLSSPLRAQEFELLPSPLLQGIEAAAPAAAGWLPARVHRPGRTESLIDVRGLPWDASQPLPRGVRALDLQNQCAFRAYAELRLGSVRAQRSDPGIPANRRGELLHLALQYLWESLRDSQTLQVITAPALNELIAQSVARALAETLAVPTPRRHRRRGGEGQLDLFAHIPASLERECRRAERLILRLCELERSRPPFRVASTEGDCRLVLAGATVRLRIDRVDELALGGTAILDYKSGRRVAPDWYGERPTHPQLLAYLCALGAEVAALATVSVNADAVRFDGLARSAGVLPKVPAVRAAAGAHAAAWPQQQAAWRAVIERLIGEFLSGDARVDPKPGACTFCHVIDICRINELRIAAEPEREGTRDAQ